MAKGGSQKQTQSGTSTTELDPAFAEMIYGNVDRARGIADKPFTPYTGVRVAAPGEAQQRYTDALGGIVNAEPGGVGALALDRAKTLAQQAGEYTPSMVSTGPISAEAIRGYLDPFLNEVVAATGADIDHAAAIADQRAKSEATSAGAWSGDGAEVLRGVLAGNYSRDKATATAGLRSQGYTTALGAAQQDAGRKLQADQGNQAAQAQAAGLRAQIADLMREISGQQLDQAAQRVGYLGQVAGLDAGYRQDVADADYEEFLRSQGYDPAMQELLNRSMGLVPQTGTTSSEGTSTVKTNPGLFGWASMLAGNAASAAKAFA